MKDVFKIFTVSKEIYDDLKDHPQEGITFLGKCRIRVKEIWRDISGFEGRYQISTFGQVKRLVYTVIHLKHHQRFVPEHILVQSKDRRGYPRITISDKNGKLKTLRIHRLVALTFIPNPKKLREVNHKDGNKLNAYIFNFEWCTSKQNTQHAFRTGIKKFKKGIDRVNCKFEKIHILAIRDALKAGFTQRKIGKYFNVSQTPIRMIGKNRSYQEVT